MSSLVQEAENEEVKELIYFCVFFVKKKGPMSKINSFGHQSLDLTIVIV